MTGQVFLVSSCIALARSTIDKVGISCEAAPGLEPILFERAFGRALSWHFYYLYLVYLLRLPLLSLHFLLQDLRLCHLLCALLILVLGKGCYKEPTSTGLRDAHRQAAGSNLGNGGYLAGQWPTFWAGAITGWTGLIRIDDNVYTWMGKPDPLPTVVNQTSFQYTSTRSIFSMIAGGVDITVTFLSPVTPEDLLRQSMPIT
jgi:hypothetical protein